ncbi:HU family DNA-binding protein [Micropruina sp.]|uniref:HU family DNA-binding protein n=1 Tax=Micropruina sp. TaxID=2737536 RepID=UPI00263615EC|nr:HU family DNA-binding protein [Micropruina sp.]
MNRSQLVEVVAGAAGLSVRDADQAVTATLEAIVATVAAGESVTLPGFGTFEQRARAARTGRNPQTGAAMEIPASIAPAFKAGTAFRRRVAAA